MKLKQPYLIAIGYVVFLALFFFIGMSKPEWPETLIAFVVVSAFYAVVVLVVKKIYAGSKKQ